MPVMSWLHRLSNNQSPVEHRLDNDTLIPSLSNISSLRAYVPKV